MVTALPLHRYRYPVPSGQPAVDVPPLLRVLGPRLPVAHLWGYRAPDGSMPVQVAEVTIRSGEPLALRGLVWPPDARPSLRPCVCMPGEVEDVARGVGWIL